MVLLAVAVLAVAAFRRLKLPPVLAYLFVGVLVGPHGMGWIDDTEDTRFLAEFGVVFLLFTVGLEFSLPQLIAMRRSVFGLGGAQVLLTGVTVAFVAMFWKLSFTAAFVVGCTLAMSSTAIVLKQLAEQLELNSRHGRLSVGVLLFQDLAVIPLLIIISALASDNASITTTLGWALLKGAAATFMLLAIGKWLLRPLFHEIASAHSAELFTLTVLLFSLSAAWVTHVSGLSLALGAFLAGMVLGETEFRHQVEADIRPFRDVLLGLFFITVGMLLNIEVLVHNFHWVLAIVLGVTVLKILLVMAFIIATGGEKGIALRTGTVLAQGGEFGFALLSIGISAQLLAPEPAQIVLASVVLSMALGPWLIRYNGWIAKRVFAASYLADRKETHKDLATGAHDISEHIVICGFGRIGQNIARFLTQEGFSYVALDLDPLRVREARAAGDSVFYGDSTHRDILDAAGLQRARVLVISFDDPRATSKILTQAKALRSDIPILVRTRDDSNLERFQAQGATEVVPETFEASLMLVSHLLLLLNLPVTKIVRLVQTVRSNRYQMLREFFHGEEHTTLADTVREGLHSVTVSQNAFAIGKSLAQLNLEGSGVIITVLRRANGISLRPRAKTRLREGDVVVLYGMPENLERAEAVLLKG